MSYEVIKVWTTKAGFRAAVTLGDGGHHCGYVGVPSTHPLHGKSHTDDCDCLTFPEGEEIGKRGVIPVLCSDGSATPGIVFDVHGGLTYSGDGDYPVASDGLWWFGYDCGHAGDGRSDAYLSSMQERYPDMPFMWSDNGVFRDADYCVSECESLADQLVSRVRGAAATQPAIKHMPADDTEGGAL